MNKVLVIILVVSALLISVGAIRAFLKKGEKKRNDNEAPDDIYPLW